jgi:hypothetical protein
MLRIKGGDEKIVSILAQKFLKGQISLKLLSIPAQKTFERTNFPQVTRVIFPKFVSPSLPSGSVKFTSVIFARLDVPWKRELNSHC